MLIVSCTGNKGYDQLLAKADSLMNVDDDSAKVAIQLLDDVKPELTEFTISQVMRYELLYHKAMNKADIAFTLDSVMLEVVDYYEHHGSANDRQDKNMNCVSTVLEYVANFLIIVCYMVINLIVLLLNKHIMNYLIEVYIYMG